MASHNAEHMRDVLSQEGTTNINNEISADSASVQTEPTANNLAPEILPSVNERLPDLVTSILAQKGFVSPADYDESDEKESDRDAYAQHQMVRDAVAQ